MSGTDPFGYMNLACLFPMGKSHGRVCLQEDYNAVMDSVVVPCSFMPAVYTDYERAFNTVAYVHGGR